MKLPILALILLFAVPIVAAADNRKKLSVEEAGIIQVMISTDLHGKLCKETYQVQTARRVFKLRFKGQAPEGLRSGLRVRFRAHRLSAKKLIIGFSKRVFQVSAEMPQPAVMGSRSVLIVKLQSSTAVAAVTHEQLAANVNSWSNRFLEYSYGSLSLDNDRENDGQPDIYTVTTDQSSAGITESAAFILCSTAMTKLNTERGVNSVLWDHTICILPPDVNYSWFGSAYLFGRSLYINGNYAHAYPDGYVHELGHNLGMSHANRNGAEYGDKTCIMGGSASTGPRHFNAPHLMQMGWLSSTLASSGAYQLNALELLPEQRVAPETMLRVFDTTVGQNLYVSFRARFGTYSSGPIEPLRTSIHIGDTLGALTHLLVTLGDGESFTQNGVTITQVSHTDRTANIEINVSGPAPAPQAPLRFRLAS